MTKREAKPPAPHREVSCWKLWDRRFRLPARIKYMSISPFSFPTRIIFGVGAIERLSAEAVAAGMLRPLIVTDRGLVSTPVFKGIAALLPGAKVFSDVDPNPAEKNVLDGTEYYLRHD